MRAARPPFFYCGLLVPIALIEAASFAVRFGLAALGLDSMLLFALRQQQLAAKKPRAPRTSTVTAVEPRAPRTFTVTAVQSVAPYR